MRIFLITLITCISIQSYCQTDITSNIGYFTPEELAYKECPFDKEASAVVLFDKASAGYDDRWSLIVTAHIRIKVLNEKGIPYGNIKIDYYSKDDNEYIKDIKAVVAYYDDAKNLSFSNLEQKNIFDSKINKYYSEISFALPNVKPGSIIDYAYTRVVKHYNPEDWNFQWKEIPVLLSFYEIYILQDHEFTYSVKKSHSIPIDIKPEPAVGKISFTMRNIPGLKDEEFMTSPNDYLQRVTFQLSRYDVGYGNTKVATNWKELSEYLLSQQYFGIQLNKSLSNTEELKTACAKTTSEYEKMNTVYDYVRNNMTWNLEGSKFSDDGIKTAWQKKTGNAGDMNLILINLLKSNDIDAYPMLISERGNGKVDTTYPFFQQFNKVIAYVNINGKPYFLDAALKSVPVGTIPYQFLNTKGFLIDKKKGCLVTIADNSKQYKDVINITGTIRKDGTVEGDGSIYNFDYSKLFKINTNKADIEKYKEYYAKECSGCKLDSFKIDGLKNDSLPLTNTFKYTSSLNKSGDYYMLNYNLFTNYTKNPFVTETRFSNIDFGCLRSCYLNESYIIPDGFTVETLPKSSTLRTPDNSMFLTRVIQKENNIIHILVKVEIRKAEFESDDYELVKGFYKQMVEYLDEPVVFKSK